MVDLHYLNKAFIKLGMSNVFLSCSCPGLWMCDNQESISDVGDHETMDIDEHEHFFLANANIVI